MFQSRILVSVRVVWIATVQAQVSSQAGEMWTKSHTTQLLSILPNISSCLPVGW